MNLRGQRPRSQALLESANFLNGLLAQRRDVRLLNRGCEPRPSISRGAAACRSGSPRAMKSAMIAAELASDASLGQAAESGARRRRPKLRYYAGVPGRRRHPAAAAERCRHAVRTDRRFGRAWPFNPDRPQLHDESGKGVGHVERDTSSRLQLPKARAVALELEVGKAGMKRDLARRHRSGCSGTPGR